MRLLRPVGDHMRAGGFTVNVNVVPRTDAYRAKGGFVASLGSCHTAFAGGYALEGHVPASAVKRLLAQRPSTKGLVVPRMPRTSPGMDAPHGQAWDVLLLGDEHLAEGIRLVPGEVASAGPAGIFRQQANQASRCLFAKFSSTWRSTPKRHIAAHCCS